MATFPVGLPNPSYDTEEECEARVYENKFGDGYGQRASAGINAVDSRVPVIWKRLTTTDAETLDSFLRECGGWDSWDWTFPLRSTSVKVICKRWTRKPIRAQLESITAIFERVYDL